MNRKCEFRTLVLAVACALSAPAWAGSTPSTLAVQGSAPVLSAPSNGQQGAVDLASSSASQLAVGDTLTLTYNYSDADGDVDASSTHVSWYFVKGNVETPISTGVVNNAATGSASGTSIMTLPVTALGAEVIKVVIQAYSETGLPVSGSTITVDNTSVGIAGGTVTAPGPVISGGNVTGGIFLASDNPSAGNGATDYSRNQSFNPQVGATYLFRAWDDANGNGVWDSGETELTSTLNSIQWKLDGTNTLASGSGAPLTLSDHSIQGATTDTYTVPVNNISSSGAASGDQGFSLKVDFD